MDAVVYVKTLLRMCKNHPVCGGCPLKSKDGCIAIMFGDMEKAVPIVEQWAKEHPVKTRQSEFLKMFPNASIDRRDGILCIDPCAIDCTKKDNKKYCNMTCTACRKDYWNKEVTDND